MDYTDLAPHANALISTDKDFEISKAKEEKG